MEILKNFEVTQLMILIIILKQQMIVVACAILHLLIEIFQHRAIKCAFFPVNLMIVMKVV